MLPIPGGLPGRWSISATALAAARNVSYGEVQGLYVALLTLAGLAQEMREPGLMKVDIESLRVRCINWRGPRAQRNGWLRIGDGNLVSGSLIRALQRSEPGLAKGAYVEGFNCKFESFVEGVGYFQV